jgi:hypothetical protein
MQDVLVSHLLWDVIWHGAVPVRHCFLVDYVICHVLCGKRFVALNAQAQLIIRGSRSCRLPLECAA